jgi:hypothetical protein
MSLPKSSRCRQGMQDVAHRAQAHNQDAELLVLL